MRPTPPSGTPTVSKRAWQRLRVGGAGTTMLSSAARPRVAAACLAARQGPRPTRRARPGLQGHPRPLRPRCLRPPSPPTARPTCQQLSPLRADLRRLRFTSCSLTPGSLVAQRQPDSAPWSSTRSSASTPICLAIRWIVSSCLPRQARPGRPRGWRHSCRSDERMARTGCSTTCWALLPGQPRKMRRGPWSLSAPSVRIRFTTGTPFDFSRALRQLPRRHAGHQPRHLPRSPPQPPSSC